MHSTLDLSSKTVTLLANTSVTSAELAKLQMVNYNSNGSINGSSVALGGSTTISTIAKHFRLQLQVV